MHERTLYNTRRQVFPSVGGEDGGEERGVWGGCVTKIVRYFTLLQIRNEQIDPDPVLFIQPFLVNF